MLAKQVVSMATNSRRIGVARTKCPVVFHSGSFSMLYSYHVSTSIAEMLGSADTILYKGA